MPRVQLQNVTKKFRLPDGRERCAINSVNLDIESGELLVIVGPSGSGKSTLLRLIAGLESVTDGQIIIGEQVVTRFLPHQRNVAMVFQNASLYPHLTIAENIGLPMRLRKIPRPILQQRVLELAELVQVKPCLDRYPTNVSGGESQRAALARAMAQNPSVYLLDEPLSHLDAPLRFQLRREILRLHERLNATLIYVTHDQSEAMAMGRRIAVINDGQIQQIATPLDLYNHPASLFVARFMGAHPMNVVAGSIHNVHGQFSFIADPPPPGEVPDDSRAQSIDAQKLAITVPGPAEKLGPWQGKPVLLGVRPEHLAIHAELAGRPRTCPAVIQSMQNLGAESLVDLDCAGHLLTARLTDTTNSLPPAGTTVWLNFDVNQIHLFDPASGRGILSP